MNLKTKRASHGRCVLKNRDSARVLKNCDSPRVKNLCSNTNTKRASQEKRRHENQWKRRVFADMPLAWCASVCHLCLKILCLRVFHMTTTIRACTNLSLFMKRFCTHKRQVKNYSIQYSVEKRLSLIFFIYLLPKDRLKVNVVHALIMACTILALK
jgi:hypothetical protein